MTSLRNLIVLYLVFRILKDSVDKIIQGNTANIVFLKSTDDSMLETLEKMSGKTHQTYTDSKMVTRSEDKMILKNEGTVSYTRSTVEEPVISYNDLAFLPARNSIMFIASNPCVWNRNETILPMSWRLYGNHTITKPGTNYTLQTIPTLSSAADFDVRANQPNFEVMLERRMKEAQYVDQAKEMYQKAHQYSDYDISKLDEDVYSDEIMDIVDTLIKRDDNVTSRSASDAKRAAEAASAETVENTDVTSELTRRETQQKLWQRKVFGQGTLSVEDLVGLNAAGKPNHQHDIVLIRAFQEYSASKFVSSDPQWFTARDDGGIGGSAAEGRPEYIRHPKGKADSEKLSAAIQDKNSRVMSNGKLTSDELAHDFNGYLATDAFLRFLAGVDGQGNARDDLPWANGAEDWPFLNGAFAKAVLKYMDRTS